MAEYPHFCGGSYISQSPLAIGARTVNWYVEPIEIPGGKGRLALYPTPGVTEFASSSASPGRGAFAQDGRAFCVIGATFYEIESNGTLTSRGTVAVDGNPATISTNGDGGGQVFVTSGNNGYILDLTTNTFTQVRTGATTMGAHLDGYFLALDAATGTLYLSDLLDGTTWDATQNAQRSIAPDPWIAMVVLDRYVILLGSETGEVWYNASTFPFPFAPHPSGLLQYGTKAPFSAKVVAGSAMWLAASAHGAGQVVRTSGFTPEIVSTFPLAVAFNQYGSVWGVSRLEDAIGDTYEDLGHTFYLLTLPSAGVTWAYDATTTMSLPHAARWAERGTWISESNLYAAWRPLFHCVAFGQHLMLDRAGGTVYRMSSDLGLDADARPIRRLRRPPGLWNQAMRVFVSEFAVDLEPGLGLTSGQGSDPQMSLRTSPNGGKTFSNERSRSAGALGAYNERTFWTRCGSGRHWQPEIVVSDPIPWRITGARWYRPGERREAA